MDNYQNYRNLGEYDGDKIVDCPEGHQCTSDCRKTGCPCWEHEHSMTNQEREIAAII